MQTVSSSPEDFILLVFVSCHPPEDVIYFLVASCNGIVSNLDLV